MSKASIGARTSFGFVDEVTWGVAVTVTKSMEITSESLVTEIGALVSAGLNEKRSLRSQVQGNISPGGGVSYEQLTEVQTSLMKHALGRNISATLADGGIRTRVSFESTSGETVLECTDIPSGFPGSGAITIIYNDVSGDLAKDENIAYSARTPTIFTIAALSQAIPKGSWVFLYDAAFTGVNTHYIEAYKDLPVGLTFEVKRDIAVFQYHGCKVNSLNEVFNAGEICTGTIEVMAKREFSGTYLTAAAAAAAATLTVADTTYFLSAGNLIVGDERDVAYTGVTATTFTTVTGLDTAKVLNTSVGQQDGVAEGLALSTEEPISSFQASVFVEEIATEVLGVEYTINNNLFADKFTLGNQLRELLPEQQRTVEGSINVEFDDLEFYNRFVFDFPFFLEIRCITGKQIGSTGVFKQKHILMPNCKFSGTTPTAAGPDLITVDMPFTSIEDTEFLQPELMQIFVNEEASI